MNINHYTLNILPQNPNSLIISYKNGEIKQEGFINVGYNSVSIYTGKYYVSINKNKNKVIVFNDDIELVKEFNDQNFICCAEKKGVVYFGALKEKSNSYGFQKLNTNKDELILEGIELPVHFSNGKAIDDIGITGNDLYLFDNIIYPKFVIRYTIVGEELEFHSISRLRASTYETINRGKVNEKWRVILSTSMGRQGLSKHISVRGSKEYWKTFNVSSTSHYEAHYKAIKDIELFDDYLYFLTEGELFRVDLNVFDKKEALSIKYCDKEFEKLMKIGDDRLALIGPESHAIIDLNDYR